MTTVTNFMSNFHFFKRYAQALGVFGVTGTIGDEAGSTFMKKHFKVCCKTSAISLRHTYCSLSIVSLFWLTKLLKSIMMKTI